MTVMLGASWVLWRIPPSPRPAEPAIALWNARAAAVHEYSLEEYVHGVVAAEMPAHFHPEALKAQAVAARTYALRRIEDDLRLPEWADAHITTDFQRHQAWIDEAEFVAARPATGEAQWAAVQEAVQATRGLVLTYGGRLIESLYHSTSGGHTEDAAHYFSGGQPYLRGVPDPFGDHSPLFTSVATFPLTTVLQRLGVEAGDGANGGGIGDGGGPSVPVAMRVSAWTPTGRVARVAVGGREVTGRDVREALGLRSNWFDVTIDGDHVVFHVRGHGHGVGMSQYGADGMARAGHSFQQILAHFYPGTRLERRY